MLYCSWSHAIPYYFTIFHAIPWDSIPYYSMLFLTIPRYSMLFHDTLFQAIAFYSTMFPAIPWYSIPYYSTIFHSISWYSIPDYSILFLSIPRVTKLPYSCYMPLSAQCGQGADSLGTAWELQGQRQTQEIKGLDNAIPFYSTILHPIPWCSIAHDPMLFLTTVVTVLHDIQCYSMRLYSLLFHAIPYYSTIFHAIPW